MPRRRTLTAPKLTQETIHECLPSIDSIARARDSLSEKAKDRELNKAPETSSPSLVTLKAVTSSKDSSLFDDLLHSYFVFPRPSEKKDVEKLVQLVCEISVLCDESTDNADRWKFFLLVAFHRRYHPKSPAFKDERKGDAGDGDSSTSVKADNADDGTAGDGERLIYYITLLSLYRLWYNVKKEEEDKNNEKMLSNLKLAIESMIQVCFDVGGSRDVNFIAECLAFETLLRLGHVTTNAQSQNSGPSNFGKTALLPALKEFVSTEDDSNALSVEDPFLDSVISKISDLLSSDLDLLSSSSAQNDTKDPKSHTSPYLSTIHVTLPHNGRGGKKGSSWQRCLVNSVVEVLIWSRIEQVSTENRFSDALKKLRMDADEPDSAHACILQMQTTIRKKRQLLNSEARDRGHLLCSQYLMDGSSINFRQIRVGKAGDLALLSRLAKKKRDENILKMLVKRNTDPSKAQKAESISDITRDWKDVNDTGINDDSLEALELQMQISMLKTTVNALKPKVSGAVDERRSVLVVQSDGFDETNAVCAILLASALSSSTSCRLFLSGVETDVSTEELTLEAVNKVLTSRMECRKDSNDDENEAVEMIILEELSDSQDAIIISNSDIVLTEETLRHVSDHDKTVRVHSPSRYDVKDPVEVKLNPDAVEKLRSKSHPIVLSVMLDCTGSMGAQIDGCKKGALKTIKTFKSLAPVSQVNFLGYWDPIRSRGDPDPRSTGYLNPNAEGAETTIQKFVDEQLPCTGGGDIPEDVPAAIEKLISDIETAAIISSSVHFLFIVADAGYRTNEEERMTKLLGQLRDLGIIAIMCPARGGMCGGFVPKVKGFFEPKGQFIKVANVTDISSIAAIVTESVRASLLQTGTLASITSSVGENFESLVQLSNFQKDLTTLKHVEVMTKEEDTSTSSDVEMDKEDPSEAVFVSSGKFGISNVDRMYLQASKLPTVCHKTLDSKFGDGKTLQEEVAVAVASRLLADGIPVEQLAKSAYPSEIVELIRATMGGHGRKRTRSKQISEEDCA